MSDIKLLNLDGSVSENGVDNSQIIGIDLGTTNSAVAVYDAGLVPTLCPMGNGNKTTMQSCVRWNGGDSFTVGPEAYNERYKSNVIYSVKRIMGTDQKIKLTLDNGYFIEMTPAEVSAEILKALKRQVHEYFPALYRCIITVPAYFNQRQIEDTVEASKLAGLECVQILKEPTSASYIYSTLGHASEGSVLIYDLGGGTFDITHMSFLSKKGISKKQITALNKLYKIDVNSMDANADDSDLYFCRVLGTYGDSKLGGDDIDSIFAKKVIDSQNLTLDKEGFEMLKLHCEQFKKLNVAGKKFTLQGNEIMLNKSELDDAIGTVFDRTMEIVSNIPAEELSAIRTVVLVGGSTKSDTLFNLLKKKFPDKEISRVLDPDSTVALGAASVAKDIQSGKGIRYQDVLPMAIGVLTDEKYISVCVPKNTSLPYSVSKVYKTMHDNQPAISVHVYQGVSTDPTECVFLGTIRDDDLPKKPAGELDVMVSFTLNSQGRLKVTTTIDGVSESKELIVDSILNVSKDNSAGKKSDVADVPIDDFEKAIWDIVVSDDKLASIIVERRSILESGDEGKLLEIEDKIMELL